MEISTPGRVGPFPRRWFERGRGGEVELPGEFSTSAERSAWIAHNIAVDDAEYRTRRASARESARLALMRAQLLRARLRAWRSE